MDQAKDTRVRIAVFYNRSSWHALISEGILPFIRTFQEKDFLAQYAVYLNTLRGDHIRLVLTPRADVGEKLTLDAEKWFSNFLSAHPSPGKPMQFPLKGFFMDYPNNTVWFNVREFKIKDRHGIGDHYHWADIRQRLSKAMLIAFAEAADTESIYTFLVYMQLGIIKAAYPNPCEAREAVQELTAYLVRSKETAAGTKGWLGAPSDNIDSDKLFTSNKTVLREIIKEVWENEHAASELPWLSDWEQACKDCIKATGSFQESFLRLSNILYQHLGIGSLDQLLVFTRLIANALREENT